MAWEEVARCAIGTDVDSLEERQIWVKPVAPCFKLNCDAAVRGGIGGLIGGVVRDCEGVVLAAFTEPVLRIEDILRLEAMAIQKGVEVARDLGIQMLTSNRVTHLLAYIGKSSANECVWTDSVPMVLFDVLKHDFYQ
ncbi:putative ribonuclease H protein [Senna tora]|uniref:Putative ribonuclease H protein n=1 Tax=Senna tora TaxID=362788 RepID=A0A834X5R4_9FABA|nr:putative ribonuclease H protein [Senna tora]